MFEENDIPEKFYEVKTFLRITQTGEPQLVRMEPMVTADNTFVPDMVRIYVDEQETPTIFLRAAAWYMLEQTNCVPLAEVMRHKHLMRN